MGTKLVRRKGLIFVVVALACRPAPPPPSRTEPRIHATVVTIQTTLQPQNKTFIHSVVIANGRARSSDDVDMWRLFDLRKKQVTFVDDVAKTVRDVPLATLIDARHKELAEPLPAPLPRAEFLATGAKRVLLGVEASEHLIRLGGYERHIWIAKHPALPNDLFAMMQASMPRSSTLAGVARDADEALMTVQGFPLLDHAELSYGNRKMVVERSVVKIEVRDVPESWLVVVSSSRREAMGSAVTPSVK
jgi:hypothetical protein